MKEKCDRVGRIVVLLKGVIDKGSIAEAKDLQNELAAALEMSNMAKESGANVLRIGSPAAEQLAEKDVFDQLN